MTVAGYVRVSSASQTHDMQVRAIERAAKQRGDAFPTTWYRDTMTGGTMKRPVLERLRADVRAGKIGRLYVYTLDRLTRTGARASLEIVEEFERYGCELVTIADPFDLQGPGRELVVLMFGYFAKQERERIAERLRSARARVEAQGGAWGRPSRMTGSQCVRATELARAGKTVRQIAAALKVPRSTVGRALVLYRGSRRARPLRPEKVSKNRGAETPEKPGLKKAKRGQSR